MTPEIIGGNLSGRYVVGMAYIGGDRVLLFGGYRKESPYYTNEIWMYDLSDNQWTNLTYAGSLTLPAARYGMGLAYAGLGQVVMFGGAGSTYFNDTWRYSIPNNIQDSVSLQIVPSGVQLTWSLPEDLSEAQFSIYRDGTQIAPSVTPGTPANGMIPYVFLDQSAVSGNIHRYRIKETYPVMSSEIFYPEVAVPYCQ